MSRYNIGISKKVIILTVFTLISFSVLTSYIFMYSPFNYTKVKGLHSLHWYDFKKPMYLEIEYWDGKVTENILQNQNEIKYIYDELIKSKKVEYTYNIWNRYVWFHFINKDDKPILLVDINSEGIAKIGNGIYLKITDDLRHFLTELQERETINLITDKKSQSKYDK